MKLENGQVILDCLMETLCWEKIFPVMQPVVLDLGAGDGSFAAAYATEHPHKNILAVERLLGRAKKIARKSVRLGLSNLKVIRIESAYLTEHLAPQGSVSEIHLLFPDPWPKKRHHERRIIQPHFLATVARALAPGGLFRFATDHEEYFQWSLPAIAACSALSLIESTQSYPFTDFEKEFRAQGKPIHERLWENVGQPSR